MASNHSYNINNISRPFIGGKYCDLNHRKQFSSINPSTGEEINKIIECEETDVDMTVSISRKAFESEIWRGQSTQEKKRIMHNFVKQIYDHKEELAYLQTLETGKPIKHSLDIDLPATIQCFEWYAESIDKIYGSIAPTDQNVWALITREPLGVIAALIPWNFPLYICALKLAPALILGNSIIVKPSEKASLSLLKLGELSLKAGIPEGVLNILTGQGKTIGRYLGCHTGIDGISFTGSTQVGKLLLGYSAQSNMKKVSLECGGKSPCIIFADVKVLEEAVKDIAFTVMFNQGAVCMAPTIVYVQKNIEQELIQKLIKELQRYHPNNPLSYDTLMGPIIDEAHLSKIQKYIGDGLNEGAKLAYGGKRTSPVKGGYFLEPTLFTQVHPDMKIAKEEIFGPVICVSSFDHIEELLPSLDLTIYGLSASIWGSSMDNILYLARRVKAGTVSLNCISDGNIATPFGGYKQSGIGRDRAFHALDNYSETKVIWMQI